MTFIQVLLKQTNKRIYLADYQIESEKKTQIPNEYTFINGGLKMCNYIKSYLLSTFKV